MQHVTIATSSGLLWLLLVTHFLAGLTALLVGTVALAVAKGGKLHKQSGIVFTYAMIASGTLASVIGAYEGKTSMIYSGMFVVYLIFTATATVKTFSWYKRPLEIALMLFVFAYAG